jgi:hypothetical protein
VVAKVGDPAYQPGVIPANTYEGQTADVPTVAIQNFLVTHEGVSADDGRLPDDQGDLRQPRPPGAAHAAGQGHQARGTAPKACRSRCIRAPRSTTAKPA